MSFGSPNYRSETTSLIGLLRRWGRKPVCVSFIADTQSMCVAEETKEGRESEGRRERREREDEKKWGGREEGIKGKKGKGAEKGLET